MSALLNSKNKLKLGIFSANCSSGQAMTQIEERWDSSWDNNLKQAQLCDAAGLEFQLPIARWIGYGGATNFQHNVLETLTWAAGLLASTKNITIFATTHTGFHNPVIAAKQLATLDQIGHGRAGLNIVCGWNKPEYEALGFQLPDDHETRYRLGQEWFDIVKKCWSDGEADEFHDYYAREYADWGAVDRVIELMFANAESFPKEVIKMLRDRMAGGHGGMLLVGTPDKVVTELEKLYEIGCAGATLSFVDFVGEFPYFRDEVLPRLEEKGLREKM